ncbi:TetR family transcriptional regulator [Saccharopolyspora sp. K220]|uniref:TetR/AcrR family transcriptional regulator n=1 Tax=Saccharopolyspora soli TaxID=2926618 RepID=UPI001F598416|nr:TetR/AcrR family transcriptional regulator [Saccharopolyspora soli]MCI2416929.1 TetR family transcriptional regulator [Saccharopolyspora soli]
MNTSKATGAPEGGTRKTARRAKTRERLLDAAYRQFSEHGINGTSIEAVTDDAGFTRGAFYSNFASKEELFFALAERENRLRLENLRERFDDAVAMLGRTGRKPDPELIEEVIADILAAQPENRQWCLLNSEFRLLAMRDPAVAPQFLESSHAFQRELATMVQAALASVGLRFLIDPLHLTRLLINQFESAMQEAILSGAEDAERAARDGVMNTLPSLVHRLTEFHPTDPK